jgi:hypothetical protein
MLRSIASSDAMRLEASFETLGSRLAPQDEAFDELLWSTCGGGN